MKVTEPSAWVQRFAPLISNTSQNAVLDVACGGGRHGRYFLGRGHRVVLIDRDIENVRDLSAADGADVVQADLENGSAWPFEGRLFAAIVVVNYLYRPLNANLIHALEPGGVLIYETFAVGNERFSRPRNPDHLLCAGELLDLVSGRLQIIAYEHGIVEAGPIPGVKQRICAINDLKVSNGKKGEPAPHPLPGF